MSEVYTVTVRTRCRACAMALAGHVPGMIKATAVFVQPHDEEERPGPLYIHSNSPRIQAHDGSPFACPEHGRASNLSEEPRSH